MLGLIQVNYVMCVCVCVCVRACDCVRVYVCAWNVHNSIVIHRVCWPAILAICYILTSKSLVCVRWTTIVSCAYSYVVYTLYVHTVLSSHVHRLHLNRYIRTLHTPIYSRYTVCAHVHMYYMLCTQAYTATHRHMCTLY